MKDLIQIFALGDFWNKFCGKNFCEFEIREMHAASKKKKTLSVIVVEDYKVMITKLGCTLI